MPPSLPTTFAPDDAYETVSQSAHSPGTKIISSGKHTITRANELAEGALQCNATQQPPIDGQEQERMGVGAVVGGIHHNARADMAANAKRL